MDLSTNESTQRQRAYAQRIEHQVKQHRTVRNPESLLHDRLVIENETDCYGKYKAIHSFKRDGQVFHRNYSFNEQELEHFRQQNPNIVTQFREPSGFNPDTRSQPQSSVYQSNQPNYNTERSGNVGYQVNQEKGPDQAPIGVSNSSNYSHVEYRNSTLPTPMSSFQHSFQDKHFPQENHHHQRTFDMNVLQSSNISGNNMETIYNNTNVPGSFPTNNGSQIQQVTQMNVPGSFPTNNGTQMNVPGSYNTSYLSNCQDGM